MTLALLLPLVSPPPLDLPPDLLGLSAIRVAGDVNADGTCDVLVADRDKSNVERVRVFSGSDGSVIHELRGRRAGDFFGFSMASVGDVDGDGVPEVAVGARGGETTVLEDGAVIEHRLRDERNAYVRLFAGKNGRLLEEIDGEYICAGSADFDGDKKPDLLLGSGDPLHSTGDGWVTVRSIAKGRSLLNITPKDDASIGRSFGASAGVLPDLDGDSVPEVVVSAPSWGTGEDECASHVFLHSGKRGHRMASTMSGAEEPGMGWILVVASDLDGDGRRDVLVAAPKSFVRALSGKTLRTIYTAPSPSPGKEEGFATTLDVVPDVDGDGVEDFVVGCDEEPMMFDIGYVVLHSGKTGAAIRKLYESSRLGGEGFEVCTLRDGAGSPTERIALRVRTRDERSELVPIDVLRIVSLRNGEVLVEKDLAKK